MKRKFLINLIILLACLSLFTGCSTKKAEIEKSNILPANKIKLTQEQENNIDLKTDNVKYHSIDDTARIQAHVQAITELVNHIYSPVDGKAVQVYVTPGKFVKKGEPLALIQSDDIGQIELDLLQQIIQADADIKQVKASLYQSSRDFLREDQLLKEKITSTSDWEAAKVQFEKDKATLSSTISKKASIITVYQQRLSLYGAGDGIAKQVVLTNHIYPFIKLCSSKSGILLNRTINNGEVVSQGTEAFTVADLSKVWLVGNAYEKDALKLHLGDSVLAYLDNFKDKSFSGKLIYVSPTLDPQSRTLEVRAELDNHVSKLKPNMYAQITAFTGKSSILSIQTSALEKYGDFTYAYVKVSPHIYEERKVKTGNSTKDFVEILDGLKVNEAVVINGTFALLGESLKKS